MKKNKSIATLRNAAEALLAKKVTNMEAFRTALPLAMAITAQVKCVKAAYKQAAEVADQLAKLCSDYALEHRSVFDGVPDVDDSGGLHGDVTVDKQTFHFASGFGEPVRCETGKQITQRFLKGLPPGWTKSKLELDKTGIKLLGVTAEQLLEAGLVRPVKNVWSVKADVPPEGVPANE